jgi:NitT/TauT family transport system ATP-binding protein
VKLHSEALEIGDRIVVLKRPAKIAYDVSFDGGTSREERELIRSRIGDVLAAWAGKESRLLT